MDADEAKIYADMEEDLFIPLKKGEITAANAATLSGKLLQMANDGESNCRTPSL